MIGRVRMLRVALISRKQFNNSTFINKYSIRGNSNCTADVLSDKVSPSDTARAFAADMSLTFLGTAASFPTAWRGVSCTALKLPSGDIWLFDVGESSQVQMQKSPIKPSRVTKIFITHLHGDHSYGLPGILCMLGVSAKQENVVQHSPDPCIDIYGPEGIRHMIRVALHLSCSKVVVSHRIHEFKDIQASGRKKHSSVLANISTVMCAEFGERGGGKDIYPDGQNRYAVVENNSEATVYAAPLVHTVPCVGFVIEEKKANTNLKLDVVKDIINRNGEALKLQYNFKREMEISKHLKALSYDDNFTFPDGATVLASDILDFSRPRKVVILGDTCDSKAITSLAMGANILVHESTNVFLPSSFVNRDSYGKYSNQKQFQQDIISKGHSTPQMAGAFAKEIGAKKLVLTHFSTRYGSSNELEFVEIMQIMKEAAKETSGLSGHEQVIAAQDFLCVPITR